MGAKDKPIPNSPEGLSIREQKFVENYIKNGGNGTRALYEACNQEITWSTASSEASTYLAKPCVQQAIVYRQSVLAEKYNITREKLVEELLSLVDACKTDKDYFNLNQAIKTLAKISGLDIRRIEIDDKRTTIKIKGETYEEATIIEEKLLPNVPRETSAPFIPLENAEIPNPEQHSETNDNLPFEEESINSKQAILKPQDESKGQNIQTPINTFEHMKDKARSDDRDKNRY